mgnify:CR=1 FL=1
MAAYLGHPFYAIVDNHGSCRLDHRRRSYYRSEDRAIADAERLTNDGSRVWVVECPDRATAIAALGNDRTLAQVWPV